MSLYFVNSMKIICAIVLMALVAVSPEHLQAAESGTLSPPDLSSHKIYYVDAITGSDSNEGDHPNCPWKSLSRANLVHFQPGDSLLLKAGTCYSGQLKPEGFGSVDDISGKIKPVIIGRYGEGPNPRIDAEGKYSAALDLYNVQGYEVSYLDLSNTGPKAEARRWGVYVHIQEFGKASHIWLKHLNIHDVNGSPYKDEGSSGALVWSNLGNGRPTFFDDLCIADCHVENCARDGIRGIGSIDTMRTNWHPSLHVVIRNNLIEKIPGDAIVIKGCDGALVESNVCRNFIRPPGWDGLGGTVSAGIWPSGSDNTIIQFNEVSGCNSQQDGQGFDSDWNCRNTIIQYNYSHDNEGGFLLVCNPGDKKMPANVGCIGTIVRYNVSVNDGLRAAGKTLAHAPIFHFGGSVKDTKIYNNTIIVPAKPNRKIDKSMVYCSDWNGGMPDNIWFANNIFYVEGDTRYIWSDGKKGVATNYLFEGNLYVGTHKNLPNDPQAIQADPLFVNLKSPQDGLASLSGLRLRANSPAIGKGVPISANDPPMRDIAGTIIPNNRPVSLGAFEFEPAEK